MQGTGKGFGIAALVLAIAAIFIPLYGLFIIWLALILASVAAFSGERPLSIASLALGVVNLLFLSPATMKMLIDIGSDNGFTLITGILFLAPIVAMFIGKKRASTSGAAS